MSPCATPAPRVTGEMCLPRVSLHTHMQELRSRRDMQIDYRSDRGKESHLHRSNVVSFSSFFLEEFPTQTVQHFSVNPVASVRPMQIASSVMSHFLCCCLLCCLWIKDETPVLRAESVIKACALFIYTIISFIEMFSK